MSATLELSQYGFDNPLIMNAAGMCKTLYPEQIAATGLPPAVDALVAGSLTPEFRAGNNGICEDLDDPLYGLNAWGMPNIGARDLQKAALRSAGNVILEDDSVLCGKPLILSVAGFSIDDYWQIVFTLLAMQHARPKAGSRNFELNFGCPNVRDDGTQHKIVSFDPQTMYDILYKLYVKHASAITSSTVAPNIQLLGIKLSPYSDPGLLKEVATIINDIHVQFPGFIDYVATCNTFPNGVGFTGSGASRLFTDQADIYGGISGEALKPISLGNASQLRGALNDDIAVIRVGGVSSGEDIWQSYSVGCAGVQIGTAYGRESASVFRRIREEYTDIYDRR